MNASLQYAQLSFFNDREHEAIGQQKKSKLWNAAKFFLDLIPNRPRKAR